MTHRDRVGEPPGRREAAGDAGHRQGFPTPSGGPPARSLWVIISETWYKLGDHPDHARPEKLRLSARDVRQGGLQEASALSHGNATLQEQGTGSG